MCKSIDAAVAMVNRSIELAKEMDDRRYYMDYVKLHKLLYIAQCHALNEYDTRLFVEEIEAHRCGPFVRALDLIPGKCGFDLFTKRLNPTDFGTIDFPLSFSRKKAIEDVLNKYGTYSTERIVYTIKDTSAFQEYASLCESHQPIDLEVLRRAGSELFK